MTLLVYRPSLVSIASFSIPNPSDVHCSLSISMSHRGHYPTTRIRFRHAPPLPQFNIASSSLSILCNRPPAVLNAGIPGPKFDFCFGVYPLGSNFTPYNFTPLVKLPLYVQAFLTRNLSLHRSCSSVSCDYTRYLILHLHVHRAFLMLELCQSLTNLPCKMASPSMYICSTY